MTSPRSASNTGNTPLSTAIGDVSAVVRRSRDGVGVVTTQKGVGARTTEERISARAAIRVGGAGARRNAVSAVITKHGVTIRAAGDGVVTRIASGVVRASAKGHGVIASASRHGVIVTAAGAGYLEKRGVDEARLNMEHLLAHVLGCRRLDLYLRFSETLQEPDLAKLRDLTRRRADGEPLQHLLGTVDFLGHELISDHRALIPRPETEHLVDWLIREVKASRLPLPATLLDMATGSGCIGLTLASAWKDCRVQLADISEEALDLARMNASRLGLDAVQLWLALSLPRLLF